MPIKVSIIMPIYNGEEYLKDAIRSILTQTFSDFELIISDDASTDASWEIAKHFAIEDHRIRILRNQYNLGLIGNLNVLLDAANGDYLARQDQDDISTPERLKHQVDFLDKNPEIGLLGTAFHQIDKNGDILLTTYQPMSDTEIRWKILFANPFAHTSVMFRHNLLHQYGLRYSDKYPHSEDYELWIRMLQYTRAANLSEPFVSWRRNEKGISQTHVEEQTNNFKKILSMQVNQLLRNYQLSEDEIISFLYLFTHTPPRKEKLGTLFTVFRIWNAFSKLPTLEPSGLRKSRRQMVYDILESLFNGLTLYRYYSDPHTFQLLANLFWYEPSYVMSYVSRKTKNMLKKTIRVADPER